MLEKIFFLKLVDLYTCLVDLNTCLGLLPKIVLVSGLVVGLVIRVIMSGYGHQEKSLSSFSSIFLLKIIMMLIVSLIQLCCSVHFK